MYFVDKLKEWWFIESNLVLVERIKMKFNWFKFMLLPKR